MRTVRREERILQRKIQRLPRRVRAGAAALAEAPPPPEAGGRPDMSQNERALGTDIYDDEVARDLYLMVMTFPECQQHLLSHCLAILNKQLMDLHKDVEFVIHEKRTLDQDGYNKVVIITDMSASTVMGRQGDGIVEYPFLWDDPATGAPRTLGVDGKWDCRALTPEECCSIVKQSAPTPDRRGNMLACNIFVPFGGVGRKQRDDRLFINVSPDGRVHEAPFIS